MGVYSGTKEGCASAVKGSEADNFQGPGMTKLTGRWRYQKRSQPWKHPQANMELPPPEDPPEEACSSQVKLTDWGLPPEVVEGYRTKGLVTMFSWQAECLLQGRALAGGNLVYSAPTSAGKTLVAEILVLKCVLERPGKKALFILPFVSLAREKMLHFQGMFGDSGVRVDGYMGSHHPPGGLAALDIAVCTIEKANGLVNHMLEDSGNLEDLVTNHHVTNYHVTNYHVTNHHVTNYHVTNYHVTNYHVTNHHVTNYHVTNYHVTNHHVTNHHVTNYHVTNYHVTNHHVTNHHVTNYHVTNYHVTNYHVTNYHVTNHHVTNYHVTNYHVTNYHVTNYHVTNHHVTNYHVTNYHVTNHHVTNYHVTNHHVTNHHVTNYHVTNYHVTNHHVTNHHVTNYHVTNYHVTNHHVTNHHVTNYHVTNYHVTNYHVTQLPFLVVDELHLVGDSHRGYLLELLLTKVLFANLQRSEEERTQIVGMSATLPNLTTLAGWLRADLYTTDFRPVPLRELVKVGPELLEGGQLLRRLDHCPLQFPADPDHTIQLALEPLLAGGHGVLVFCPTKNWCEQLAQNLAREIYRLGSLSANSTSSELTAGRRLREVLNSDRLAEILELLRKTPAGLDEILVRTVAFGVAFHHAGLTMEERDVLEAGFRAGHLKLLVATSTLSSGVNLPARRVLIRSPHFRGNSLDPLAYRQMAGRAGRKGADTQGESILLCKENEKAAAEALIGAEMQPVQSCLLQTNGDLSSSLKRAILEVVASGVAKQPQDVRQYMSCTLLACAVSAEQDEVTAAVDGCIGFLQEQELITITGEDFHPTKLGLAVLASSLSPDEGLRVFTELQKARQCFVLDSDLHLIYQVTPPYISDMLEQIDWLHYMNLWEKLPAGQRRVGELVGVEERFLARCVRGQNPTGPRQKRLLGIHRRFFAALALADLVSEVPLHEVASKFSCGRGLLQSLQQSAATFAGDRGNFVHNWLSCVSSIKEL
ncbi:POLQ [Cordylochernes scorpioides]|uniref:POLQ n=1 Tax=Cordylochernes scorpioides TaxID=51811 RepID=A0ABY6KNH3_9ARAC|nr:POLQ [Cordylochernes scorpioides]